MNWRIAMNSSSAQEKQPLDSYEYDDEGPKEADIIEGEKATNNTDDEVFFRRAETYGIEKRLYMHKLLTKEEEHKLCISAKAGDGKAKNELVEKNQKLVLSVALTCFRPKNSTIQDMVQYGTLGLIHAIDKFEPEKGFRFSTYAYWWIKQSITRNMENSERTVYVPNYVIKKANIARKKREEIEQNKMLGIKVSGNSLLYDEEMSLSICSNASSIDAQLGNNGEKEESEKTLHEFISNDDHERVNEQIQGEQNAKLIALALEKILTEKELKIIKLRFALSDNGLEHTLEEISDHVCLTRERVRQIIISATRKLKAHFESLGLSQEDFF
jgi:RNA polymerase sigma factor (sigma-70 family)